MGTTVKTMKKAVSTTARTTGRATGKVVRMSWFPGAVLTLLVLVSFALEFAPLYSIECFAHSLLSSLRQATEQDSIVLVKIDDLSAREFGSQTLAPRD